MQYKIKTHCKASEEVGEEDSHSYAFVLVWFIVVVGEHFRDQLKHPWEPWFTWNEWIILSTCIEYSPRMTKSLSTIVALLAILLNLSIKLSWLSLQGGEKIKTK